MTNWIRMFPFLILFPGYFLYHWSALNGWTSLSLGGYINEVSAFVCVWYLVFWLTGSMERTRLTLIDTTFILFITWLLLTVLVHAAMSSAPGVTKNYLAAFLQILACYLVARNLSIQASHSATVGILLLSVAAVVWAAYQGTINLLLASNDVSGAATYQGLARALLMTAIFGVINIEARPLRVSLYAVVLFALFLIGARSEIIGAVIAFIVLEFIVSRWRLYLLIVIAILAAVLALVLINSIDTISEYFPDNRFVILLQVWDSDGSVVERVYQHEIALKAIGSSPFFGDYGHYEKSDSAGSYAHSWLGVWVDFGLIGVILYLIFYGAVVVSALCIYTNAATMNTKSTKTYAAAGIGVLAMVTLLTLFAKHFTDTGLATAAGLIAAITSMVSLRKKVRGRSAGFLPHPTQTNTATSK